MSNFAQLNGLISGHFPDQGIDPTSGAMYAGAVSAAELDELTKALAVGSDRDPPGSFAAGDGFAFRTEDLDPLMRTSTYTTKNIVMWPMLQKQGADQTVFEWNETELYGQDGYAGFMNDGGLPELQDSTVSRQYGYTKFMGVQGAVTHASTLVKSASGNLVAGEVERKMMALLGMVERSLFEADEALDPVQWSSYNAQLLRAIAAGRAPASCQLDKRGASMTVDDIELFNADAASEGRWGAITDLFCNPLVKSRLNMATFPANRGAQGVGATGGKIGGSFQTVETSVGEVAIHPTPFIRRSIVAAANGAGDPSRRPPTPILSVAVTTPSDATAQFISTDAGDYVYQVVARNSFGASVPLAVGTVTVAAGQRVQFGIQAGAGQATSFFEVYRSTRNGSTPYRIARIRNPNSGFTIVTVQDRNETLPNTTDAIAFNWMPSVVGFKQLAPFMKVDLARIDLNIRWAQVCYGAPALYLPRQAQLIRNIGV